MDDEEKAKQTREFNQALFDKLRPQYKPQLSLAEPGRSELDEEILEEELFEEPELTDEAQAQRAAADKAVLDYTRQCIKEDTFGEKSPRYRRPG